LEPGECLAYGHNYAEIAPRTDYLTAGHAYTAEVAVRPETVRRSTLPEGKSPDLERECWRPPASGACVGQAAALEGHPKRAARLYEAACDRGDALACVRVSYLTRTGKGGPPDMARYWLFRSKACKLGVASACIRR
jgi:TPR repeat protein